MVRRGSPLDPAQALPLDPGGHLDEPLPGDHGVETSRDLRTYFVGKTKRLWVLVLIAWF